MRILVVFTVLLMSLGLSGQVGTKFPGLKGTNLDEKSVSVPQKNGKYSVVAIAFHRDAEDALKKWLNPLYDVFIKTEKKNAQDFDLADIYDVNFIFIPLISGFRRVADDFKKKTDQAYWAYILDTEKTDIGALQEALGIKNNKIPYFYVLDKEGKIVASESGSYSVAKLDKLEDAVE
jgi:hypothetical protein